MESSIKKHLGYKELRMARFYPSSLVRFFSVISLVLANLSSPSAQMRDSPSDHAQQGTLFLSQGRWEEAIRALNTALQLDPNQAEIHANLGMAHYFKGDSASAIPEFQTAIRLDKERIDAAHGLGLALYDRGDFAGAVSAFRSSSQQNPAAYYNLGNSLEQQGNRAEALEAYRKYLEAVPPSPDTAKLGEAVRNNRFPTPAAGTAQEHLRRGQAQLDSKNVDGALVDFLAALRLKPNSAEASNFLGLAFRAAGNLDEAIAAYQTAIRLDGKFSATYRNLAQAFEDKGDRAAAAQGYDRYLLLAPGAPDAAEIREKIVKLRGGR
jgi:tetratricopeptide (TPR) repeat protein